MATASDEYRQLVNSYFQLYTDNTDIHDHFEHRFAWWYPSAHRDWTNELRKNSFLLPTDLIRISAAIPNPIKLTPARLLLESGIAATPAVAVTDARAGFAMLRYGWYFREVLEGQLLVLPSECNEMEPRLKQIMAEELGAGLAYFVLREYMKIDYLCDVFSIMKKGLIIAVNQSKKRPDFCGLDENDHLTLAECKGTLTGVKEIQKALRRGKKQLAAVKPARLQQSKSNFVLGTFFSTLNSGDPSILKITDPEADFLGENISEDIETLIRCSYAKVCRYASRDKLAELLLNHNDWPVDLDFLESPDRNYCPVGLDPFGNLIVLRRSVFRILAQNSSGKLHQRLGEIENVERGKQSLSNGVSMIAPI